MKRKQLFSILVIYKDSSHDVFLSYGFDSSSVLECFLDCLHPDRLSLVDKTFVDLALFI